MRLEVAVEKRVTGFTLQVELSTDEEVVVLFGPSGAGKTLTLQCLAGVIRPDRGRIAVDGEVLFDAGRRIDVPPQRRRIGYVPQSYALFPHLTVGQNLAFGLRRWNPRDARAEVARMVDLLGLERLVGRLPRQLSGGQQQRVALARALATRPRLLLLDEPFSALDVTLRSQLRDELLTVQRELRVGVVFVTHDLDDTYALADAVAVFEQGRILQVGPRAEVFRRPVSETVARYTGARNILAGTVVRGDVDAALIAIGALQIETVAVTAGTGEAVRVVIRPEVVRLLDTAEKPAPDESIVPSILRCAAAQGAYYTAEVELGRAGGPVVEVAVPVWWWERHRPEPAAACRVAIPRGAVHVLPGGKGE